MRIFIVILISSIGALVFSQNVTYVSVNFDTVKTSFPERCLGEWEGTMYMYSFNQLRDSVPVRFTATKTDSLGVYGWRTEYLSAKRPMTKDYFLKIKDLDKGHYILDEGDGVTIDEFNYGNKLFSAFEVQDIYLTTTTELIGDTLIFEVTSGKKIPTENEVTSYSFDHVQRVVFKRVDPLR